MAKAKSGGTRSMIRGRVGADVYSLGKDGKGKRQQVVRSLAEQVTNPRTSAQMKGRMITKSVSAITKAMSVIVRNAFDGLAIGQPSISKFRSLLYKAYKEDAAKAEPTFGYLPYGSKLIPACSVQFNDRGFNLPMGANATFDNQFGSGYLKIGVAFQVTSSRSDKTMDFGELKKQIFGDCTDGYLTIFGWGNTSDAQAGAKLFFGRLHLKNLSDDTLFDSEVFVDDIFEESEILTNAPDVQTSSGSKPGVNAELYLGQYAQGIAHPFVFYLNVDNPYVSGMIVSSKKNGVWKHSIGMVRNYSSSQLGGLEGETIIDWGNDTTPQKLPADYASAIATYPVGTEQFLNGGEL